MNKAVKQWQVEIIWWVFTLLLCSLVLLPIKSNGIDFPYYTYNVVFVISAITLTRYLFFLSISWLRDQFVYQAAVIFLLIPLLFFMGQGLNEFITFFDNNGPDVLVRQLPKERAAAINTYVKTEYFFFGVWAMIAGIIMPIRILINVWKRYMAKERKKG